MFVSSRRNFLKRSSLLALSGGVLTSAQADRLTSLVLGCEKLDSISPVIEVLVSRT